jgi:hypothetical protein
MRRLRRILIELARSERGIALPMALMITVISMGMAAVPVVASMNAQSGDSHSQGTNEALAAAEAGAELAVLKQSEDLVNSTENNIVYCAEGTTLNPSGSAQAGWCTRFPSATTREPIGSAEYSYQVRPCYALAAGACGESEVATTCDTQNGLFVQVVSTGYATVAGREVTKRIETTGCAGTIASIPMIEHKTELITTESELKTWKESSSTGTDPEATKHQEERTTVTNEKTVHEHERTVYQENVVKVEEEIKTVKEHHEDVETKETPGEVYFETTKTAPPNVWAAGQIVGIEGLVMNNNAQVWNGGAGSNKAVSMVGSANVCGSVHYGTTFTTDNSTSSKSPSNCAAGRPATQGTATYPAVTLPSNIATENSDYRLCSETACHAGLDPVTSGTWQRENISYNAANKQLTIKYNALTLEGTAPYYLCQLILAGGSSLYAGSGKSITIYFAPPSSCPGLNGAAQLQIANGTFVYADASSGPKFLFVGNSANPSESRVELAGGSRSEQFVIYGPYTKMVINNGIEMTGAIIGNTIELGGGANLNKYGPFTPPASETFLPTQETTVEKHKESTKTSKPTKRIEELEKRRTTYLEKITYITKEIEYNEAQLTLIEKRETENKSNSSRERQEKINSLEIKKSEILSWITQNEGQIGGAEALEKQSFSECTAAPPTVGLPPNQGC